MPVRDRASTYAQIDVDDQSCELDGRMIAMDDSLTLTLPLCIAALHREREPGFATAYVSVNRP